jgi:nicotinamide riboside transporter PnuC
MKQKKEKKGYLNLYIFLTSVAVITLSFFIFLGFEYRLSYVPLVLFLGCVLDGLLCIYFVKEKKKVWCIAFGAIAVFLFVTGWILLF